MEKSKKQNKQKIQEKQKVYKPTSAKLDMQEVICSKCGKKKLVNNRATGFDCCNLRQKIPIPLLNAKSNKASLSSENNSKSEISNDKLDNASASDVTFPIKKADEETEVLILDKSPSKKIEIEEKKEKSLSDYKFQCNKCKKYFDEKMQTIVNGKIINKCPFCLVEFER